METDVYYIMSHNIMLVNVEILKINPIIKYYNTI